MDKTIKKKLDDFFTKYQRLVYKKGEILIRAEDDPSGIFYLKRGVVKEYAISRSGDEVVVNIFKPISFFPMNWAVNNTSNKFFFEASCDTLVWRAPRVDVISFLKKEPDVLYNLLSRVYSGVDGLLVRLAYLMAGSAYTRLVTEIVIYAKRFSKGDSQIELGISEVDLAFQLGMARETVSRGVSVLKEKGILVVKNKRLVIVSLQRLEEEVEGGV